VAEVVLKAPHGEVSNEVVEAMHAGKVWLWLTPNVGGLVSENVFTWQEAYLDGIAHRQVVEVGIERWQLGGSEELGYPRTHRQSGNQSSNAVVSGLQKALDRG
jgi:hypothetical protein